MKKPMLKISWAVRVFCCLILFCFLQQKSTTETVMLSVREYLSSRHVAMQVLSARQSLTSVFGMGTGGPSALISRTEEPAAFTTGFNSPNWTRTSDTLINSQVLWLKACIIRKLTISSTAVCMSKFTSIHAIAVIHLSPFQSSRNCR